MSLPILHTGQLGCYGQDGEDVPCPGSGQDGESARGLAWPAPRFAVGDGVVRDLLTGLAWSRNANINEFPVTWQEALDAVGELNAQRYCGHHDWRLPNRRELRSLMSYGTRKPALPTGHPFDNVFSGWYWTSTTAAINPAYAWYVHMEGARMFYGRKDQYYLFWPVRGKSRVLAATGQKRCFDQQGREVECRGSGQDGFHQTGEAWPDPRFSADGLLARDNLTGLVWLRRGDITDAPVSWQEALDLVTRLNREAFAGRSDWRLPCVNELESLVDSSRHSPALPLNHPFTGLRNVYWSSTTSFFETDWAWALYLDKGAIGVGHKPGRTFHVWPVAS